MPIDFFNLDGQNPAPVKRNHLIVANTLITISILSFVLMLGGCCACIGTTKTEYGEEEYYQKPDGSLGYGAKSSSSGGESSAIFSAVSGAICVIAFIAGTFVRISGETAKED
jgi:hypothetical protein